MIPWSETAAARAKRLRIEERNRRWFAHYTPAHLHYCALARQVSGERATILHLGGGRDSMGVERSLQGFAGRLVCLDPDLDGLRFNPTALKVAGCGERLPFPDSLFDLIVAEYVFEHLEHPCEVLCECRRCLRPGGRIVFMCPNRYGYIYLVSSVTPYWLHVKVKKRAMRVEEADVFPTYYRLNTVKRIRTAARQAGLRLEMISSYVGWPTYWEFSDFLHRIFVIAHRVLEILPATAHLTLVGMLRRDS